MLKKGTRFGRNRIGLLRRRGSREDDLVPDWKRASWRIGVEDEYSTSKRDGSQED